MNCVFVFVENVQYFTLETFQNTLKTMRNCHKNDDERSSNWIITDNTKPTLTTLLNAIKATHTMFNKAAPFP
jgi:hypothetical protein